MNLFECDVELKPIEYEEEPITFIIPEKFIEDFTNKRKWNESNWSKDKEWSFE